MHKPIKAKLLVVLSLAVMGAAGCGAAAANTSSTPAAPATTTPAQTPDQDFLTSLQAASTWPQINALPLDTSDLIALAHEGVTDIAADDNGIATIGDLQQMSSQEESVVAPNPASVTPVTWQEAVDLLTAAITPPANSTCSYSQTTCPTGPYVAAGADGLGYGVTIHAWQYYEGNYTLSDSTLPTDEMPPDAYAVTAG